MRARVLRRRLALLADELPVPRLQPVVVVRVLVVRVLLVLRRHGGEGRAGAEAVRLVVRQQARHLLRFRVRGGAHGDARLVVHHHQAVELLVAAADAGGGRVELPQLVQVRGGAGVVQPLVHHQEVLLPPVLQQAVYV